MNKRRKKKKKEEEGAPGRENGEDVKQNFFLCGVKINT